MRSPSRPRWSRSSRRPAPAGPWRATPGSSFALDTELDDDLRLEGAARELVRAVNDLRKEAGLELDDRIHLFVQVEDDLGMRLDEAGWLAFVAREVLARTMEASERAAPDGPEVDLAGLGTARVRLERA